MRQVRQQDEGAIYVTLTLGPSRLELPGIEPLESEGGCCRHVMREACGSRGSVVTNSRASDDHPP